MHKILLLLLFWTLGASAHPASRWADRVVAQYEESHFPWEDVVPPAEYDSSFFEETTLQVQKPLTQAQPAPVTQVYQFKDHTSLENLAARSNGELLLTAISDPNLFRVDPNKKGNRKAELVYQFPGATSLTGIVETSPDVFVVVAGNWSTQTFEGVRGSFEIWSVDFNSKKPTVKSIAAIPEAAGLNGITNCHSSETIVLIADSDVGGLWKLDTSTGEYSMIFRDPLFTNCTAKFPLGLNGVSMYEGSIHFANSALRIYGQVPIYEDGSPSAEIEIIGRAVPGAVAFDDLVLDWEGNAWIATHPNVVTQITLSGKQRNFTGGDTELANPTSIVWGRGSPEAEKTLYISTNGVSSKGFVGAQVVAMDTRFL